MPQDTDSQLRSPKPSKYYAQVLEGKVIICKASGMACILWGTEKNQRYTYLVPEQAAIAKELTDKKVRFTLMANPYKDFLFFQYGLAEIINMVDLLKH